MSYTYTLIKNDTVFANLSKGTTIMACDFNSLRIMNCDDMNISAVKSFIPRTDVAFFTRVEAN